MPMARMWRGLVAAALLMCAEAADSTAGTPVPTQKRKFCNSTLPGDYRYETCGEFCKSAKAKNHCQYCKCHTCGFCTAELIQASQRKTARIMKKKGPFEKKKKKKDPAEPAGKMAGKKKKKKVKKAKRRARAA